MILAVDELRRQSMRLRGDTESIRDYDFGALEPLCDIDDIDEGCAEFVPNWREAIPDRWWRCRLSRTSDDSFAFQFAQAVSEHLG